MTISVSSLAIPALVAVLVVLFLIRRKLKKFLFRILLIVGALAAIGFAVARILFNI